MKVIPLIFFLMLAGCSFSPVKTSLDGKVFSCDLLVGRWSGSYMSEKWNFSTSFVSEYLPRGIYRGYFTNTGNEALKDNDTQELRAWFCDGKTFGTFLIATSDGISPEDAISSHKVYEFIELTKNYRKYRTIVGNEIGKTYESYKIPAESRWFKSHVSEPIDLSKPK